MKIPIGLTEVGMHRHQLHSCENKKKHDLIECSCDSFVFYGVRINEEFYNILSFQTIDYYFTHKNFRIFLLHLLIMFTHFFFFLWEEHFLGITPSHFGFSV